MNKNRLIYYLRIAIAVALVGSILYIFDFSTILNLFKKIDYAWAVTTLAANILLFFISSLSVWILLSVINRISFSKFIRHYCYAFTAGLFIPGQIGDASISLFLKKDGVPFTHGGLAYIIDKSISLLIFFIVASVGVGIFFPQVNLYWFLLIPITGGILLWGLYTLISKARCHFVILEKIYRSLSGITSALYKYKNNWHIILIIVGIAILKWLIVSSSYAIGFFAFGKIVPWPGIGVIPILSTFVGYIPISVSGIGTVEYSAVFLFSRIGMESSVVVSVYIFMRLIQYLIGMTALAFFGLSNYISQQSVKTSTLDD